MSQGNCPQPSFAGLAQVLILLLLFRIPLSTAAIPTELRFDHLSIEDGLSQISITSILQDQYGFMWFGTQNGLNRYDGYEFQVFKRDRQRPDETLTGNFIQCLSEDPYDGNIWIGTFTGGVSRFNPKDESFRNYRHDPDDQHSLSNNIVRSIYVDPLHQVWVGGRGGLDRLDRSSDRFERIQISEAQNIHVRDITGADDGSIWIATNLGVFFKAPGTDEFLPLSLGTLPQTTEINTLLRDRDNNLWVGTERKGLLRVSANGQDVRHFRHREERPNSLSHSSIIDLMEDRDGKIWVGTNGGLNLLMEVDSGSFLHYKVDSSNPFSLSENLISYLHEDRAGIVWVGTWAAGINYFDSSKVQFATITADDERGSTGLIAGEDGRIWFGSFSGLHYLTQDFTAAAAIKHNPEVENAALRDRLGGIDYSAYEPLIWVATRQGLSRYRIDAPWIEPVALENTRVYWVLEDMDGSVWAGTYSKGLYRLDRDSFEILQHYPMSHVAYLWQDTPGELWVATTSGLYWLQTQSGEKAHYQHQQGVEDGLSYRTATWISRDKQKRYWVGTQGGGFSQMILEDDDPRKARFLTYNTANGLEADAVGAIVDDERNNLWISTTAGVSKFNVADREFSNFGYPEGALQGGYFVGSAAKDRSGNIYFGGPAGLTAFEPASIQLSDYAPPVRITAFRMFNQEVNLTQTTGYSLLNRPIFMQDKLHLNYEQSFFSFDFAALHFSAPDKNRYAYKLEGFDRDWNYVNADRRFASYTNLDPGHYRFAVRGTNKDGVWSDHQASLEIIVHPPWWQTYWARGIGITAAVIGLYALYYWRVRMLKYRSLELARKVSLQTRELREANRRLEVLSNTDDLTGLFNRRAFLEQAEREYERFQRHNTVFSIVLLDVDHFKTLNDTHGHACGDSVLVHLANLLQSALRTGDVLARWGGEEFIVLLPNTELEGGRKAAEKMRELLNTNPFAYGNLTLPVTLTAGVACIHRQEDINNCIHRSDNALYRGKASGRDQVCIEPNPTEIS
ncbi:diguanylate cyclase [Pseudomaricurvus alkylphenolicus]|uniref:ligand-binding sensor domain-containing diguanylate cyclase n=1 Tax=Pseudomaricurvus alkylphenolicus TaxID=1306991 RepID=UPI001421E714|nr:ligand-binding sensor domain-containing diguanylate cyclase [Pseudomaricurvus alkylphenolicus]NIB40369.1 diguanylate cyclase [Pseudomaricurvus alkylphenolicus]